MFRSAIKIKEVKKELGQLVKSLRKRNKISQEELAQQLKISRLTVQNLESGKNFTIDTLLKVLRHFELLDSLHQLLGEQIKGNQKTNSLY